MQINKKAQVGGLTNVAYAILLFGIVIGIGLLVMTKLGDQTVNCQGTTGSGTVTNATARLNGTGYNTNSSNYYNFVPVVTNIVNATDGANIIVLANATVKGSVIYNTTAVVWDAVNISYTYTYDDRHYWNTSTQTCLDGGLQNSATGVGGSYTAIAYVVTQMGSTGLAGWLPVIIVVLIAVFILALFGARRQY